MPVAVDLSSLHPKVCIGELPPWRPISSRELSKLLGVSLQSLANWRVRGTGPKCEPPGTGRGNKIFYRPDRVAEWLAKKASSYWEFSADWLTERGVGPPVRTEDGVVHHIQLLEKLRIWDERR